MSPIVPVSAPAAARGPAPMRALATVLGQGRRQAGWLVLGVLVSLTALVVGLGLMVAAAQGLLTRSGADVAADLVAGVAVALGAPVLVRLLGVSRAVLRYAERLATHEGTFRLLAALRVWLFRAVAVGSAGGLGYRRSGDLASRLVSDIEALDSSYSRVLVPLCGAMLLLPALLLGVSSAGAGAMLVVGGLFVLAAFVLPALGARRSLAVGQDLAAAAAALRVSVLDSIVGIKEVRVFGAERSVAEASQAREAELLRAQERLAASASVMDAAAGLCGQAAVLAVLAGAGHPAAALLSVFLVAAAFEAVSGLPRAGVLVGHAASSAVRLQDAARPSGIADPATPGRPPADATLRFESVSVRWQESRPPVLDGLSLEIAPGSRVAILGPSGSGKSTLAAVAMRVLAPQSGRVTLGGTDIAALGAAELRGRIALLSQATHVFDDTVRGNLLLGRPDAEDAALWAALDQAALAEVVRALPDGLDSWVGEGGARLSGGQARRLALARTLLSPAAIVILDEPATGLDAETERTFLRNALDAAGGRTVVLITHRLTGVERLDRIWRLSGGRAVAAAA